MLVERPLQYKLATKQKGKQPIPFSFYLSLIFHSSPSLLLHQKKVTQFSPILSLSLNFIFPAFISMNSSMEITSKPQELEARPPTNSPTSNGSSSNSNASLQIPTPPLTPRTISRSEPNPYPTTFVQADTNNFKQVVQMLTGSSESIKQSPKTTLNSDPHPPQTKGYIPPIKTGQKKQSFKLYERRNSLKNGFMISPLIPGGFVNSSFSPRKAEILSPSILDFPSLVLSPVTPLNEDQFINKSPSSIGSSSSSEEEKAIAEKKFYLHPSPRTSTPRGPDPQLLPLFPVTSPRVSGSSS